jgi:hypothetical protein
VGAAEGLRLEDADSERMADLDRAITRSAEVPARVDLDARLPVVFLPARRMHRTTAIRAMCREVRPVEVLLSPMAYRE